MFIKGLLLFLLLALSLPGKAQILRLRTVNYGWLEPLPPLQALFDDYLKTVESDINEDQPIRNTNRLLEGVAYSTLASSKGLGSNYVIDSEKYFLSAGIGGATGIVKKMWPSKMKSVAWVEHRGWR